MHIDALRAFARLTKDSSHNTHLMGITNNSKKVQRDFLFIAERGVHNDGHKYITSAIERGASALLVEDSKAVPQSFSGYIFEAENVRSISPLIAAQYYDSPSKGLFAIGVTGTNGKTSLTYLIEHLFNKAGQLTGVIGTIDHHVGKRIWPTEVTTPNPIELQERLAEFVQAGAKTLAIEVSSHAIDQKRIAGIEFDVCIFTNLTRDHLDYHSSMEEYFDVKQSLFDGILGSSKKSSVYSIINKDDSWGAKIKTSQRSTIWSYGEKDADFSFELKSMGFTGTKFVLHSPKGTLLIASPLIGRHNIYNVMAATAAGLAGGLNLADIRESLVTFGGIPGRLQLVSNKRDLAVLVDYAHSPDALENVLHALHKVRDETKSKNKIICLFGCGGDRDKGKRPMMAKVAQSLADKVIVTSDNPRSEDPLQIINDICTGFTPSESAYLVEPDRARAIAQAIELAEPGDAVLIAGKGHEDYQIIGKEKFYFSDFETARRCLE